ncbi:inositol monophosphatase family protein [Kutzneria sp. CA-103260]|uniref:inositol monophosphatase family protein n=1 Tax=Kutzneria sp. CA-103260 TaxID=2802641 RepID=UPI001BA87D06|nr:inositol monophosphatase family protein [Kutzneria sp. CA-103260]QUQ66976.1 myo-inositol-1(or 4)-monophosphatase [Kutzneria sp. CA-103260]
MNLTPVVTEAADRLLAVFSADARPGGKSDMFEAGSRNETVALDLLRPALKELRPEAVWLDDEMETTPLPPGEFWAVDAVEGNVNHVHGMPEWCVTVTLIRDGEPVHTVVRQPIGDRTYTATRGEGAYLNGKRLRASAKTDLDAAIVSTGQAEAGLPNTHRRIGESITAMLDEALLVRAFVPSTFPLLLLASGQHDVFWQYEPVLPGIAPGMLLATEAGGVVSRIDGSPWRAGSPDVLVAAPGLHSAAVSVLSAVA